MGDREIHYLILTQLVEEKKETKKKTIEELEKRKRKVNFDEARPNQRIG